MKKLLCISLFAVLLAGLHTGAVLAQNPTPTDDEVNRIAHQLYCPVCENTPLDVCPTGACRQERDLIRQQLSQGWSEDRIKQYFVTQIGDRVLAEPPRTGLNWLLYILPPAFFLTGAFFLLRAMQAWTKPAHASTVETVLPPDVPQDEYVAKLEEELKKRN